MFILHLTGCNVNIQEFSMKASKFNEEQIALALHMAEQTSVDEVTRKLGIAQATFYRRKSKYGGLLPAEVKRLKQLGLIVEKQ